ncbi:hypothetical protein PB1A_0929 [Leuconostoc inhae]|uniref:Uncharacterized protein n=1 Tax=Leuconostoc inhae TaxID=178001 RepID=A0AAN2QTW5_9LACO|nr:hypothetical protein PL111_1806 [Leuconostoc inhae]CUW04814.1 hypothetical protein PB1A_0929 [Leuconostoc inhae]CUW10229.1 hypothetical protein PB1E_1166 [Leuconostoc gasicomitatum]CUW18257.1 hypothetical protein C120C_1013 [Leuconostoc inhae]CUW20649.1 hypothetical protein KSL4_1882 [Leuconostoc inhae]
MIGDLFNEFILSFNNRRIKNNLNGRSPAQCHRTTTEIVD